MINTVDVFGQVSFHWKKEVDFYSVGYRIFHRQAFFV